MEEIAAAGKIIELYGISGAVALLAVAALKGIAEATRAVYRDFFKPYGKKYLDSGLAVMASRRAFYAACEKRVALSISEPPQYDGSACGSVNQPEPPGDRRIRSSAPVLKIVSPKIDPIDGGSYPFIRRSDSEEEP